MLSKDLSAASTAKTVNYLVIYQTHKMNLNRKNDLQTM